MSRRILLAATLLIITLTTAALTTARPGAAQPASPTEVVYLAGAAVADITPTLEGNPTFWMAGYGIGRPATSVHDEIQSRVLILDDGITPMAIVTVDLLGLTSNDIALVQEAMVARVPGLENHILVSASHTHEAPDTIGLWGGVGEPPFAHPRPLEWITYIAEQTALITEQAWLSRTPVTMTLANIDHAILDDVVRDSRDPQVHDPVARLMLLEANDASGTVATLINWASHPEVLGSENEAITADFVKWVRDEVEEQIGGVTLFVNGAIGGLLTSNSGSIFPELPDDSFEKAEAVGRAVGERMLEHTFNPGPNDVVATYTTLPPITYQTRIYGVPVENPLFLIAHRLNRVPKTMYRQFQIPEEERWRPNTNPLAKYTDFNASFITFGPVAMLTYGGELYPELLVGGIERLGEPPFNEAPLEPALVENPNFLPYTFKFFLGLTNDFTGYVVPVAQWDGFYEGEYGEDFATSWDEAAIVSYNLHLLMLGYESFTYPAEAEIPEWLWPLYETYKP